MVRRVLALCAVLSLLVTSHAAGAPAPKKVTRVLIQKKAHTMKLLAADGTEVQSYTVAIGPGGLGPKRQEGDMTTPVGRYHVTTRQPSKYKIFLGIDYPTAADWKRFNALKASGELPKEATIGGAIGIHGPPVSVPDVLKPAVKLRDWTAGCIAVNDDEITEVASLVKDGTVVDIED
ncbi:MAG: L,D-transpeptidase family protein [Labilithrix sp.]|nr:L,D-transpeptidase family protein [Labilithrix sp.]MCW5816943.1 L,D-transpeptidase family protein [Labilithrix sp.]